MSTTAHSEDRAPAGTSGGAPLQLLHVAGCPLAERVRATVHRCLAASGRSAVVEELEGPYPSPTLLIGGKDVTGCTLDLVPCCRLDLPTDEQVLAALASIAAEADREGSWSASASDC